MKEGRPIEMSGRQRGYAISFYVDPEQMNIIEDIRWREHKSKSAVIRQALSEYLKAHSAGNDTFKLDNWQQDPEFQAVPTILADPQMWFKYLQDCTPEDRTRILKQANLIRTNAINIGNFKKK